MPVPVKWSAADTTVVYPFVGAAAERLSSITPEVSGGFRISFTEETTSGSDYAVFAQMGADGSQSNTRTIHAASNVEVRSPVGALLSDGRHVEVWTEEPAAGGGDLRDIYYKATHLFGADLYNRSYDAIGPANQSDPAVAGSYRFAGFATASLDFSVAGGQVIVNFYRYSLTLASFEIPANTTPGVIDNGSGMRDVAITATPNNTYVVVWSGAGGVIRGQVFENFGGAIGTEFSCDTALFDTNPDVTALADGRFVVTWLSSDLTVRGRFFQEDGTADGAAFDIAADAVYSVNNNVTSAALKDGRFVTVYIDTNGDVVGQTTFASGVADGATFLINSDQTANKKHPSIATLADGRFAVSWTDSIGGVDRITSTIFDPRQAGLNASATSWEDDWHGSDFADRVYLGGGNDAFSGDSGNDTAYGEAGQDTVFGDEGNDKLYGGNDDDSLDGGANSDTLNGELGNDILNGGIGSDTINGGDGNDQASGGTEGDILNGNNGNDTLNGDAGLDVVKGGNGDDIINGGVDKDTLDGDANNDTLTGGDGGDTLRGGAGNDRQTGGLGNDVHLGGAGLDKFVFADDTEGSDRIDDWVALDDQLEIDASAFGGGLAAGALAANRLVVGAAPVANQAFGQFLYNTASGQLSWDIDGTGAAAAVAITRLLNGGVAVAALAVADFDIVA